ncbi:extracellular solute-binding protein, partial [Bacteroidota bacterium]
MSKEFRKRKYLHMILLYMLINTTFFLFALISCSREKEENLLTFYYQADDSLKKSVIDELADEFESSTGIKINAKSFFGDETNQLMKYNASGFDVIELDCNNIREYIKADLLLHLDSIKLFVNLYETIKCGDYKSDVRKYGIPWLFDVYTLYCNNDLLEKTSLDLNELNVIDDIILFSGMLDSLPGIRGYGMVMNDKGNSLKSYLPFLWSNGGSFGIKDMKFELMNDINIITLYRYLDLSRYSYLGTRHEINMEFITGRLGFCPAGLELKTLIKEMNPTLDYSIRVFPGKDTSDGISLINASYLCISNNSDKKENVIKFINFLQNNTTLKKIFSKVKGFALPAKSNIYLPLSQFDDEKPFLMQAENSKIYCTDKEIEGIIERAIFSAITLKESPDKALEYAEDRI